MTHPLETYLALIAITVVVGMVFSKSSIPTTLILVITGMVLSFLPGFSDIELDPDLILDVFLPLLLYEATMLFSWRDVKKNINPIAMLSIGHVLFITVIIAVIFHHMIPGLSWPLAFVLGAVVSPPDDIAIVSIAEKIHMPHRIVTILKGEAILNNATALTVFRFSLAAIATHEFSAIYAFTDFFSVIILETLYGIILGYLIGKLRMQIRDPIIQTMISLLTPFIAYLPATRLGGCGVLATVAAGLMIEHKFSERFPPEVRLLARSTWTILGFVFQSLLFLLVGLDLRAILQGIASLPTSLLMLYSFIIILVTVVGRFIWVYPTTYLPGWLFPNNKINSHMPWQHPFIVSWAGMRGGISLAAALAIPSLPVMANGVDPRDLIVFLVFCVIVATLLLQGLTLPWILNLLGVHKHRQREKYHEYVTELQARLKITDAVLQWLIQYKDQMANDPKLLEDIKFQINGYHLLKSRLKEVIRNYRYKKDLRYNEELDLYESIKLSGQLIELERKKLLQLWRDEEINHYIKNKLLQQLDHRSKHLTG